MTQDQGMGGWHTGGEPGQQQPAPYAEPSPYGQQPFAQQPQQYGQVQPYQQPMAQQPMMAQPMVMAPVMAKPKTNGLAVASMVVALASLFFVYFCFIGEIVALILGMIAKKRIKEAGEGGNGMATAGIVIACIILGLWVVGLISVVAIFGSIGMLGLGAAGGS